MTTDRKQNVWLRLTLEQFWITEVIWVAWSVWVNVNISLSVLCEFVFHLTQTKSMQRILITNLPWVIIQPRWPRGKQLDCGCQGPLFESCSNASSTGGWQLLEPYGILNQKVVAMSGWSLKTIKAIARSQLANGKWHRSWMFDGVKVMSLDNAHEIPLW